ncbi:uncharacterized protein LOC144099580 [Amblyomma americanum]
MDVRSRHGGLVLDEQKLSEHLNVKSAGSIESFVDLANHTPDEQRGVLADHGMVRSTLSAIQWGNVKAARLSKIIVETIILAEQAGLFLDTVTCDDESWNRSMRRLFRIEGKSFMSLN